MLICYRYNKKGDLLMIDIRIGVVVVKDPAKMRMEDSKSEEYCPGDLKYIDPERHEQFVNKMFAIVNS